MVVMHKKTLREYVTSNAQAAEGLRLWHKQMLAGNWASLAEMHQDIPSVDLIGGERFVFNIKGNHYRVLAVVVFKMRTVLIKGIFTHAEYSKLSKPQLLTYQ